jgi:hypothetical protein
MADNNLLRTQFLIDLFAGRPRMVAGFCGKEDARGMLL